MYSSKLVDLYYRLTKTQLRSLRKFVKSPYHNKRKDVTALFELMYKTPLENRKVLRKENAFPQIYKGEKFSSDKIDYLMSFLFKVIEQFLIHENLTGNKTKAQIALMEEYRNLGMPKHFQQSLKKAEKHQQENPLRDISYHEKAFSIEKEKYHFLAIQERDASKNLQELSNKLDIRFLSQKLKDACRLLAHQAVAKQQYDFGLLNVILPYIKTNESLLEHPSVSSYYYYYLASVEKKGEQNFKKFKYIFLQSTEIFEKTELLDLYTLGVNYCVKKINTGQQKYEEELFEIYGGGLKFNILTDNNKLNQFTFNNITKLALKLDKISWTEQFIEKHKHLVDKRYHNTYVHNAYSMLFFAKGEYMNTMIRLQQVDYEELFITLDAKVLLLKVYYKLEEYDALESLINSFKVFLRRKEVIAYHREIYKNFIRVFQKLINLPPFDKKAKEKLSNEIESIKKLLEKKWLLKQLDI